MRTQLCLALATCGVLAACQPVEKDHPPPITELGVGRVLTAQETTATGGETRGERAGKGFLMGGLAGAMYAGVVFSEDNMGQSHLFAYDIATPGQPHMAAQSFSRAAVGDCVKMSMVEAQIVLEKVEPAACAAIAP